jgi:DNA modification methylase
VGSLFGNALFYGDNLPILRDQIDAESVDLVYLDPPFNSNANYNVLFKQSDGAPGSAQVHAFEDSWHWGPEAERTYHDLIHGGSTELADLAEALRTMLGTSDMLAYLVMMAPRLVELRRVLKPTGSLYLHCDPTSSHYLKMLLDAIFGPRNFRNEVIWKRTGAHGAAKKFAPVHDVILLYGRGGTTVWNRQFHPYDESYLSTKYRFDDARGRYRLITLQPPGRRNGATGQPWRGFDPDRKGMHWRFPPHRLDELDEEGVIVWGRPGTTPQLKHYLDLEAGVPVQDVWTDLPPVNSRAAERIGYPTQKPVALLERIIRASSNPGDLVLDPFCGCGTTVDAAQRLDRNWIGIDISYLAIDIIDKRLRKVYGDSVAATYEIKGSPHDIEGARALAVRDKFEFERWAVSLVDAQPNSKQVGDRGIDGVARFATGPKTYRRILVSVKGGANNPGFVRDLAGTVSANRAAMGIMVTLNPPTKGMLEAAASAGVYRHVNGRTYPRVQIMAVADLLGGRTPDRPSTLMPYVEGESMTEEPEEGGQGRRRDLRGA